MNRILQLSIITLLFTACGSKLPSTSNLFSGKWILNELDGNPVQVSGTDKDASVTFNYNNNAVSGIGGCNRFTGTFTADARKMQFSPLAATRMMCPDQAFEDKYLKILSEVRQYSLEGEKLVFKNDGGKVIAVFKQRNY